MLSKRKTKNLAEKPHSGSTSQNDPLVNQLEYMNTQRPSKPKLPKILEPSKLLLPMDLTKSCLH